MVYPAIYIPPRVSNQLPRKQLEKAHLVPQSLGSDDSDLIADTLVGLEVESKLRVVPLNDDLGGLLDGLGANC